VVRILSRSEQFRNNFKAFLLEYWRRYDGLGDGHLNYSGYESFSPWFHERATSPETLRRCWQKVQADNTHLRGILYDYRHKTGKKVSKDIVKVDMSEPRFQFGEEK
jgi:hypothetical protein